MVVYAYKCTCYEYVSACLYKHQKQRCTTMMTKGIFHIHQKENQRMLMAAMERTAPGQRFPSSAERTLASPTFVYMRVIFIIDIITTCLVQFRDSWVGLVAEQRGRRMQVGANLFVTIIMIIVLDIIIIIRVIPNIHNQSPQYHNHHLKTHSGEK